MYYGSRRASARPRSTTQHVAVVGEPLYSLEVRLSMSQQQQESFYTAWKYDLACRSSSKRASTRPRSTTWYTIVVREPLHGLEVRLSMWRQQESLCRASIRPRSTTWHAVVVGEPLHGLEVRLSIQRWRESLCRASVRPRSTTWHTVVVGEPLYSLEVRLSMQQQQESLCTAQKYDLACCSRREPLYSLEVRPGMQQQQESLYTTQKYDLVYYGSGRASVRPRSMTQHIAVVGEPLYGLEVRPNMQQ